MKTQAIRPRPLSSAPTPADWTEGQVLLQALQLPIRWRDQSRHVLLDTAFDAGQRFLATWQAWRVDPQRCARLAFVALESAPLQAGDLARWVSTCPWPELAQQLLRHWPPLTHNLHTLSFEGGRVQLLLALGDSRAWLSDLVARCDSLMLPAAHLGQWDRHALKALAKLTAPQAQLVAQSCDPGLAERLAQTGFDCRIQGQLTQGRYAPRYQPSPPAARLAALPQAQHAVVVGAGIAGCAAAWALRQQGLAVTLIEQGARIATAGSGNPMGLFHGTLNPDDGLHARFNRAAALVTQQVLRDLQLPGLVPGLLRTESSRSVDEMQALIDALGLPAEYVQALSAGTAATRAGWRGSGLPAWYYPGGGALSPAAYAQALLDTAAGVTLRVNSCAQQLRRRGTQWQLLDAEGQVLTESDLVVLTAGLGSLGFLDDHHWPLRPQRGQITHVPAGTPGMQVPHAAVAGAGYAVPDGRGGLWCGATAQDHVMEPCLLTSDHEHNLAQLQRLSGSQLQITDPSALQGRVGWRLIAEDRLPLVGALPQRSPSGQVRRDQARMIEREPGLWVATAMASRGITWAALSARTLAALATGAPSPLEATLLDAIDPARFDARRARSAAA